MTSPTLSFDIENLAPMPDSVARLAKIVGDANTDVSQVARVIEFDQALTTNVLRLANSAWSGSRSRRGTGLVPPTTSNRRQTRQKRGCSGAPALSRHRWISVLGASGSSGSSGSTGSSRLPRSRSASRKASRSRGV